MQCSAVQWSGVRCSGVDCGAVECSAVECGGVECGAVRWHPPNVSCWTRRSFSAALCRSFSTAASSAAEQRQTVKATQTAIDDATGTSLVVFQCRHLIQQRGDVLVLQGRGGGSAGYEMRGQQRASTRTSYTGKAHVTRSLYKCKEHVTTTRYKCKAHVTTAHATSAKNT